MSEVHVTIRYNTDLLKVLKQRPHHQMIKSVLCVSQTEHLNKAVTIHRGLV